MMLAEEHVERVARAMCVAEAVNPDQIVYAGAPVMVGAYHYSVGPQQRLWHTKVPAARAALMEVNAILGEAR